MLNKQKRQIQKLRKGDRKLYRELYEKYYEQFLSYALSALKSQRLAESVLKETFVRIYDERASLDPNVDLSIQLFRILENCVCSLLGQAASDQELRQEIQNCITFKDRIVPETTADKKETFIIRAIHNKILQQKLLHELAATRR